MNAARVVKVLGLNNTGQNRTQRLLITFAMEALIINSAKLWDKSGKALNLERFLQHKGVMDKESKILKLKHAELAAKHKITIDRLQKWRNEIVVHISGSLTSLEEFRKFYGDDISDIQRMLHDVSELIQTTSWYPKVVPMKFIDYKEIEKDLNLKIKV